MVAVLIVCTGNICRSPIAEGLLRDALKTFPDIEVGSAGVATGYGQAPSPHAVEVTRRALAAERVAVNCPTLYRDCAGDAAPPTPAELSPLRGEI